jgi:hypothetical protein
MREARLAAPQAPGKEFPKTPLGPKLLFRRISGIVSPSGVGIEFAHCDMLPPGNMGLLQIERKVRMK